MSQEQLSEDEQILLAEMRVAGLPEMVERIIQSTVTRTRSELVAQATRLLHRGKIRYSRNYGEPNPSEPFAVEFVLSMEDFNEFQELLSDTLHQVAGDLPPQRSMTKDEVASEHEFHKQVYKPIEMDPDPLRDVRRLALELERKMHSGAYPDHELTTYVALQTRLIIKAALLADPRRREKISPLLLAREIAEAVVEQTGEKLTLKQMAAFTDIGASKIAKAFGGELPHSTVTEQLNKREMVYTFLELPTHVQFQIGRELGLSQHETQANNTETFTQWFREARERGLLEKFNEAIQRERDSLDRIYGGKT